MADSSIEKFTGVPEWFGSLFPSGWWRDVPSVFTDSQLAVEQFVKDGEEVVRVQIPGVDPDKDIDISVQGNHLTIHAERREETRDDKHGLRTEFRYGAFTRTVPLRAGATVEDVKASYADGVLEVRVPVGEAAAKKVQITRS